MSSGGCGLIWGCPAYLPPVGGALRLTRVRHATALDGSAQKMPYTLRMSYFHLLSAFKATPCSTTLPGSLVTLVGQWIYGTGADHGLGKRVFAAKLRNHLGPCVGMTQWVVLDTAVEADQQNGMELDQQVRPWLCTDTLIYPFECLNMETERSVGWLVAGRELCCSSNKAAASTQPLQASIG